ncbi:hypothetical protein UFOVP1304_55 [uncultured Caudovirales phage]|uniref:Uncharacterized protein n=1 Tax=uncultured Caudovirales phage TaxID=2100421 RepID=A0A6J5RUF2_9CAUD|nr:hypothetical protein UFOVP1304_55 [uncultured Caudovirales phage]
MKDESIEDAMCLWEVILTLPNAERDWWLDGGAAAARSLVAELSPFCSAAYEHAVSRGFDDCFDWEFCPAWIEIVSVRSIERDLHPCETASAYKTIAEEIVARWEGNLKTVSPRKAMSEESDYTDEQRYPLWGAST